MLLTTTMDATLYGVLEYLHDTFLDLHHQPSTKLQQQRKQQATAVLHAPERITRAACKPVWVQWSLGVDP